MNQKGLTQQIVNLEKSIFALCRGMDYNIMGFRVKAFRDNELQDILDVLVELKVNLYELISESEVKIE